MIEIERRRLDPRERERWRDRLAAKPIIARHAFWTDPELFVLSALAWLAVVIVTFDHWLGDPSPLVLGGVRIVATAAVVLSVRAALHMDAAREASWPQGRFLFSWGFVEIDRDVARIVPGPELRIDLRPCWGLLPIRMVLGDARRRTTIAIDTQELARVAAAIGDDDRLEPIGGGYRDGRSHVEGAPAAWPLSRAVREIAWAVPACLVMTLAPVRSGDVPTLLAGAETTSTFHAPLRPEWEVRLVGPAGVRIEPRIDLNGCLGDRTIHAAASYLERALAAPSLGSEPDVVPTVYRATHATIWARCTWHVDPEHGTFRSVDVEWGLDRYSSTWLSRRARIDASHVLAAIERCRRPGEPIDVEPKALAERSARLATRVALHDLMRDPPEGDASCEREIVRRIETSPR